MVLTRSPPPPRPLRAHISWLHRLPVWAAISAAAAAAKPAAAHAGAAAVPAVPEPTAIRREFFLVQNKINAFVVNSYHSCVYAILNNVQAE